MTTIIWVSPSQRPSRPKGGTEYAAAGWKQFGGDAEKGHFRQHVPRRQRYILKKGYDLWDPFQAPKDPIDIRRDRTQRTSQMLVREFLQSRPLQTYSNAYGRAVLEISMGIVNEEEKYRAMYEFSCWYKDLLERETQE